MIRLQKDIDELFAMRMSLARSGNHTKMLSSLYLLRTAEENSEPILFLLHAPKKFIKQAHLRNKLKRWMREAIRQSEQVEKVNAILAEKNTQALVLIRADFKPSKDHAWLQIQEDIRIIMNRLMKNLHSS